MVLRVQAKVANFGVLVAEETLAPPATQMICLSEPGRHVLVMRRPMLADWLMRRLEAGLQCPPLARALFLRVSSREI